MKSYEQEDDLIARSIVGRPSARWRRNPAFPEHTGAGHVKGREEPKTREDDGEPEHEQDQERHRDIAAFLLHKLPTRGCDVDSEITPSWAAVAGASIVRTFKTNATG